MLLYSSFRMGLAKIASKIFFVKRDRIPFQLMFWGNIDPEYLLLKVSDFICVAILFHKSKKFY